MDVRFKNMFVRDNETQRSASAFTLIELLVVIAIIAILAAVLLPVLQRAQQKSFQTNCMNNSRQIMLGWRMYAEDNSDLLAPNDYPYTTPYRLSTNKRSLYNWVCGTMEQSFDADFIQELSDPVGTAMASYIQRAKLRFRRQFEVFLRTCWLLPARNATGRLRNPRLPRRYINNHRARMRAVLRYDYCK